MGVYRVGVGEQTRRLVVIVEVKNALRELLGHQELWRSGRRALFHYPCGAHIPVSSPGAFFRLALVGTGILARTLNRRRNRLYAQWGKLGSRLEQTSKRPSAAAHQER